MTELDVRSPNGGTPAWAPGQMSGRLDDDLTTGRPTTLTSPSPSFSLPPVVGTRPAADNEFTTVEVAGEAVSVGGESGQEGAHEEVSTDGESAVVTATEAQLAESGEESAVSDLRGIEGFVESDGSGFETATETGLAEAGSAVTETAEFLPILAALVPTLISTVGPMIGKAIAGRLSPRAKAVINKVPPPVAGASRPQPGSQAALLAQIAQLLRTIQTRPGGEGALEALDETVVDEAVAVIEVIIGTDDRVRIRNTNQIPWRRICALRITFPTGAVYRGTGFLIGPRAVATAGHCVYLHGQGGWASKVEVIPGADGPSRPFGSAESSQFRSVGGWVNDRRPESDYGCVVLPPGSFGGHNLGSFGIGALDTQELLAKPAVVVNYPGDKPFAELWGTARKLKSVGPKILLYTHGTTGGSSGGPVYITRNGSRTVVGIHNYGASTGNSATRITQPVAQRLIAWSKL